MKESNPQATPKEISKLLSAAWKAVPDEEKRRLRLQVKVWVLPSKCCVDQHVTTAPTESSSLLDACWTFIENDITFLIL